MRRSIGVGLVLAVLVLWMGTVTVWARPIQELVRLASTDLLPEVRQAAALALAELWVEDVIPTEELKRLTEEGATPELREAAARALARRIVTEALETAALEELAARSPLDPVRRRAAELLSDRLIEEGRTLDELEALAVQGATAELRGAAVPALIEALVASARRTEELIALAREGESAELRAAAARAVVRRLQPRLEGLSLEALEGVVAGGSLSFPRIVGQGVAELRAAAAEALSDELAGLSLDALEALAGDPENSAELRGAAARALSVKLLGAGRTRAELERLADQGATSELRAAADGALVEALVEAVGRGELTLEELAASVADETVSEELRQARADAVFTLLRPYLIFLTDQPLLEAVLRGEAVEIGGVLIDGALIYFRRAAGDFLAGLWLQFGAVNRFQDPVAELVALAGDAALTPEYRAAAGRALVKFLASQREEALAVLADLKRRLDRIVIQGRRGRTEEALEALEEWRALLEAYRLLLVVTAEAAGDLGVPERLRSIKATLASLPAAIRAQDARQMRRLSNAVKGELSIIEVIVSSAPQVDEAQLRELAARGATPELRGAAARALSARLEADLASGEVDLPALMDLAATGASAELRGAAVPALSRALTASDLSTETLLDLAVTSSSEAVRSAAARAWIARVVESGEAPQPQGAAARMGSQELMAIANGAGVELGTITLEGAIPQLRAALAERLPARWRAAQVPTEVLRHLAVEGETPELRRAAQEALSERFLAEGRSQDELIALAVQGESPELRGAAAEALLAVLIEARLSEAQLFMLVARYSLVGPNPHSSPELVWALVRALADRFLHPLAEALSGVRRQASSG